MIIGAQNLVLGTNVGLEVINGRELAVKISNKFTLGAGGLDLANGAVGTDQLGNNAVTPQKADLAATWTFAADKLQISSDGSGGNDPVRYSQFNAFSQGLRQKPNVRVATTAALPAYTAVGSVLTMDANGVLTVDGANLVLNDRLIVKNETGANEKYNGLFYVSTEGTAGVAAVLTRATDGDTADKIREGSFAWVEQGTTNNNTRWAVVTGPTTLNTDPIVWNEIPSVLVTAGAGLTMSGTTIDVATANDSMTINADSIQVKLDSQGAITVQAGQGLRVIADESTIERNSNAIRVKDAGITSAKIANDAVLSAKLKMKRRFQRIIGNAANGTALTLSRAVIAGREEAVQLTEDNAFIDWVSAGPDTSPSKEFTVSGTSVTLGFTQITDAVYRVWYDSEDA